MSAKRSKKYDIVRSQSLHRPRDGIFGTYRSLCSSPLPPASSWSRVSDSDAGASSSDHRRSLPSVLLPRPHSDHSLYRRDSRDDSSMWASGSREHLNNSSPRLHVHVPRTFPRRRVPFELFDDLPESKVDPEPVEDTQRTELKAGKDAVRNCNDKTAPSKQPNADVDRKKAAASQIQVVFIQHKPKNEVSPKTNDLTPKTSQNGDVIKPFSTWCKPPLPKPKSSAAEKVVNYKNNLEYQEVSRDNDRTVYITSLTRGQQHQQSQESVLCQERPDGTVFGVLRTPTRERRKTCPPSLVTLNDKFRASNRSANRPENGINAAEWTNHDSFCYFYDNGDQIVRSDDSLNCLTADDSSYSLLQTLPGGDESRYQTTADDDEINECYNFRLILPKEDVVRHSKRQDFCRSMLYEDAVIGRAENGKILVLNGGGIHAPENHHEPEPKSLTYGAVDGQNNGLYPEDSLYLRTPPQLVRERYSRSRSKSELGLTYANSHSNQQQQQRVESGNSTGGAAGELYRQRISVIDGNRTKPVTNRLKSPMVVKEVLKKMASQPSGMISNGNSRFGGAANGRVAKQLQRFSYHANSTTIVSEKSSTVKKTNPRAPDMKNDLDGAEAEAMRAIQDLDKSLSEALQESSSPGFEMKTHKSGSGQGPLNHTATATSGPKTKLYAVHRKTVEIGQNQNTQLSGTKSVISDVDQVPADAPEVQSDNLIEEMYLSECKPPRAGSTTVVGTNANGNGYSSHPRVSERYGNKSQAAANGRNISDSKELATSNQYADSNKIPQHRQYANRAIQHNDFNNKNTPHHNINGQLQTTTAASLADGGSGDAGGSCNGGRPSSATGRNIYSGGPAYQFYRRYKPDFLQPNEETEHYSVGMNDEDTVCAEIHNSGDSDNVDDLEGAVVGRTSTSSVDSGNSSHHQGHFVVVAIDFGTTYSGYAFSFTRDPENIHMMRKWEGGDPGVNNQKTPTTLLLTPGGQFHSFGFTARDYYNDMEPQEAKKWMFFEKFKMSLHHNENLTRDTQILAANGKAMPAVTVFAHALRYFRDHALQELSDQSATTIMNEDVRWVVTVPAIWRQPAKQFMRTAAYEAGIASPETSDQLLIALEPEAASIYCRRLRMHQLVPEGPTQQRLSVYRKSDATETVSEPAIIEDKGTRYMVVDCGGGTVDITVHELQDKQGTLKELHKATGGPHGSVGVDMEFECLLEDIFGADFIAQFKLKRPASFVDLMNAFEARKRNANPFQNNPLNISLPFSFIDFYKKCKGSIESAIKKHGDKDVQYRSSQGMIRLESAAMIRLFEPTLSKIKEHISDILNNPSVQKISYLFLVGGFAESRVLQKAIRDEFSSRLTVIIPHGVSLAVLRGAVLFGLDPTIVNVRRSRMTYGVGILNRFVHGVHPSEKLVVKDGIQWCADVFDKFVTTDQSVGLGDVVRRSYTPATAGQACSIIHIYCSERDDVQFITDPGVRRCGTLMLDLTDAKKLQNVPRRREIETCMIFGDTEIKASARDVATGKCVKVEIDFLNR